MTGWLQLLPAIAGSWLLTFLLHSTLLLGLLRVALPYLDPAPATEDRLLRLALPGCLMAPTLSLLLGAALGGPTSLVGVHARALGMRAGSLTLEIRAPGLLAVAPTAASALTVAAWATIAALGVAALVLRWRSGLAALDRRPLGAPYPERWATRQARRLGAPEPRLTRSDHLRGPVALGRCEICVPSDFLRLPRDQQRVLLAHELAHLRRRDPLRGVALELLARALFFQPLLVWLGHRLRRVAELRADEAAVRLTGEPTSLARSLERLVSRLADPVPAPPGPAAGESAVLERVRHLLSPPPRHRPSVPRLLTLGLAALAPFVVALVAPGAGLSLTAMGQAAVTAGEPVVRIRPDDSLELRVRLDPERTARVSVAGAEIDLSRGHARRLAPEGHVVVRDEHHGQTTREYRLEGPAGDPAAGPAADTVALPAWVTRRLQRALRR